MTITIQQKNGGADVIDYNNPLKPLLLARPNRGVYVDPEHYSIDYDDFLGDALITNYSGAKGTDAQAVAPTVAISGTYARRGHMSMTCGDTTVVAESLASLTKGLNYRAVDGEIYLKTAIVLDAITNVALNVGFSDTLATTTLEEPFSIAATTITSNASDAVCFVFDTAQTNDFFHLQGVKADTDTALRNTSIAPVAATVITLEIIITMAGHATFFIDGQNVGAVANAVTTTTLLTPIITLMARTTSVRTLYADYLLITQSRSKSLA